MTPKRSMLVNEIVRRVLGALSPVLHGMETRIMARFDDERAARQRLGNDIQAAISKNAETVKKLTDMLDTEGDEEMAAIAKEANDHAAALEAAFGTGTSPVSSAATQDPGTAGAGDAPKADPVV